ncbi:hypothetical protein O9929_16825 [Vibrio lentus]|nr:hypothetical protein [Vibrio lentus]
MLESSLQNGTTRVGIDGCGGSYSRSWRVRMVPNGDEETKDIANAVRYAVDNGANVFNMSFGKLLAT